MEPRCRDTKTWKGAVGFNIGGKDALAVWLHSPSAILKTETKLALSVSNTSASSSAPAPSPASAPRTNAAEAAHTPPTAGTSTVPRYASIAARCGAGAPPPPPRSSAAAAAFKYGGRRLNVADAVSSSHVGT